MISTQPFITGALSGFKTLFKTCSEQVSKCYKLFPSFHAWTMFPPLIIFQSYSKKFPKALAGWNLRSLWEKLSRQVYRLWSRITTMGLSSLKIVGIWEKSQLWRNIQCNAERHCFELSRDALGNTSPSDQEISLGWGLYLCQIAKCNIFIYVSIHTAVQWTVGAFLIWVLCRT